MILCGSPHAAYLAHKAEIDAAVAVVLERGRYVLGEEVAAFERAFASYSGVLYGVGVGSGTEALHIALAACGIGRGDEVITVSFTCSATVAAVELAGATPVLVDIEPGYFTLDPRRLEAVITERTKAIIPVHLFGHPASMNEILDIARRHDLYVVEDCCQAHGASFGGRLVGSFGDIGCFSFYPTKNLGAFGDGGMIVTSDAALAERARSLREYGWRSERYVSQEPGLNSRLDELQAAVLSVKLRYLDIDNEVRRRIAAYYNERLQDSDSMVPIVRKSALHAWHQYVLQLADRESVRTFLHGRDIHALVHYPVPIHLQPAYAERLSGRDDLRYSVEASHHVLSLPVYPQMTDTEVEFVAETVRTACHAVVKAPALQSAA